MGPRVAAAPAVCPEAGGPGGFRVTGDSPNGSRDDGKDDPHPSTRGMGVEPSTHLQGGLQHPCLPGGMASLLRVVCPSNLYIRVFFAL